MSNSALDDLVSMGPIPGVEGGGDISQVVRNNLENPALPGETPNQTSNRIQQQQVQTQRQQSQADQQAQQVQRIRAKDLAARAIPSYTDDSGSVQPVRDSTGAALTNYDPNANVGYDAGGNPQKMTYGETGAPALSDPYQGAPTTTDDQGNVYKTPKGLPWQWSGIDDQKAAAAKAADDDKSVAKLATSLGRQVTLQERAAHLAGKDLQDTQKQLAGIVPDFALSPDMEPDELKQKINDTFSYASNPAANQSRGWFDGSPSPEALQVRQQLDQDKQKALALADKHFSLRDTLAQQQADLAQKNAILQQAAERQTQRAATPDALAALGIPGLDGGESAQAPQQAPGIPGMDGQQPGDQQAATATQGQSADRQSQITPEQQKAQQTVAAALPPSAQQALAPVKTDDSGQVKPEGFWATAGRAFGSKIIPAVGTAVGGLASGALAIESGPGAIAADIAGGALAGTATAKAQRAIMGDQWAQQNDAQMDANAKEHPIAAQIGSMVPFLVSLFGGGGALVKNAAGEVAGKAVTSIGKTAIEDAIATGAKYEAPMLERVATHAAMGARAGASEGAQEKYVEGKDVSVVDSAAKSALQFGATGLFMPAKTLLGQVFGRSVTDAAAMTFAGDLYDSAIHGKPFDLEKTASQFAGDVPAFVAQNALLGFLSHGMAALNRPGSDLAVSDGVPTGSSDNVADELRELRKTDPEKYKQRFAEEVAKRQQGEYAVTPPTMAERLNIIDIRLAQMRNSPEIDHSAEKANLEAEKESISKGKTAPAEQTPVPTTASQAAPETPGIPGMESSPTSQAPKAPENTQEAAPAAPAEQPKGILLHPTNDLGMTSDENRATLNNITRVRKRTNDAGKTVYSVEHTLPDGGKGHGYSDDPSLEYHPNFDAENLEQPPVASQPRDTNGVVSQETPSGETQAATPSDAKVAKQARNREINGELIALGQEARGLLNGEPSPESEARLKAIDTRQKELVAEAKGAPKAPAVPTIPGMETSGQAVTPVDEAAHEAATSPQNGAPEPTDAQKKAGNYQLGHTRISGMDISVENPEGSIRSGTDPNGQKWQTTMQDHYGYLRGTVGKDKDHVDVFIKPGTPEDYSGPVFVVNQNDAKGSFDEHKAILGASSEEEAKQIYLRNYSAGQEQRIHSIAEMPMDQFKEWATNGQKTDPAKVDRLVRESEAEPTPQPQVSATDTGKAASGTATPSAAPVTAKDYNAEAKSIAPSLSYRGQRGTSHIFANAETKKTAEVPVTASPEERHQALQKLAGKKINENASTTQKPNPEGHPKGTVGRGGSTATNAGSVTRSGEQRNGLSSPLVADKEQAGGNGDAPERTGSGSGRPPATVAERADAGETAATTLQPTEQPVAGRPDGHEGTQGKGQKVAISDEADKALDAAFEGLFDAQGANAPVSKIVQSELPPDKIGSFVSAAKALIEGGIKTPEAMAAVLDQKFGKKARAYSEALWDAFGMASKALRGTHDWEKIYGALDAPAIQTNPAPSEVTAPAIQSNESPQRVRLNSGPQTFTVEEKLPQSETEKANGEQFYRVKNERTGEMQTVERRDIKPVGGGDVKEPSVSTESTPDVWSKAGWREGGVGGTFVKKAENGRASIEASSSESGVRWKVRITGKNGAIADTILPTDREARKWADEQLSSPSILERGEPLLPKPAIRPTSEPVSNDTSTAKTGITDFGEKIYGARKDLWGKFKHAAQEELPADAADITLSRNLPEPDYELAISQSVPVDSLATFKALRDSLPSKPRKSYKLARWAEAVRSMHSIMRNLVAGETEIPQASIDALTSKMNSEVLDRISLYRRLGYPTFTKAQDWGVTQVDSFIDANGKRLETPVPVTMAEYKGRMQSNMHVTGHDAAAVGKVTDLIRSRIESEIAKPAQNKGAKPIPFNLYRDRFTNDVFIGKKAVNGVVRLKTGFENGKLARQYVTDHQQELEDQWNGMKAIPDYRRPINSPRQGPERRAGDATPEQFQDAFGFRGVQFGNWVEDSRRQVDMNEAFDALMDLSEALGIPPKALSLDGSLGLAFGSRGHGGKNAPAAHYEPNNIVINLTKKSGPGSLAHEWFHALDNYFARLDKTGETKPQFLDRYATGWADVPNAMRPEVWAAFKHIRDAISSGTFFDRSKKLDAARSTPYFSQTIEKAARAFERYVEQKLWSKEISNDYLVNLAQGIEVEGEDSPLPTNAEMKGGITQAYDNLFNTLDTKQTERGIALHANTPEGQNKEVASDGGKGDANERERVQHNIQATLSSLRGESGGSVLETEAADIGRSARSIQAEQGVALQDGERQALIQWAVQNGRVIPPSRFENREPEDGGVEHDVWFDPQTEQVEKITRDKPIQVSDYLERLALQNAIFNDDTQIKGVTFHKPSGRVAIVTSQPFRSGEPPTQADIDSKMEELGFEKFGTPDGLYRGHGITIADAMPKNWIKDTATGELMPIDLQIVASPEAQANTPLDTETKEAQSPDREQALPESRPAAPAGSQGSAPEPGGTGRSASEVDRREETVRSFAGTIARFRGHAQRLGIRFVPVVRGQAPAGIAIRTSDGAALYNVQAFRETLHAVPKEKRNAFASTIYSEELIHRAADLVNLNGTQEYADIFNALPERTQELVRQTYTSASDPVALGAEYVRMVAQRRAGLPVTELFYDKTNAEELEHVLDQDQGPITEKFVADALDMMENGVTHGGGSQPTGGNRIASAAQPDDSRGANNPLSKLKEKMMPGLEIGRDAIKGIQSLVLPTAKSPEHLKAAEELGARMGEMNRRAESTRVAFHKDWLTFEKMGVHREDVPLDKNPGIKFASDMSTGRAMNADMTAIANKMNAEDAKRLDLLEKAGVPLQTVRENYFPGVWTNESRQAFNLAMEEARQAGIIPEGASVNTATADQKAWVKERVDQYLEGGKGSQKDALGYLTRSPFKGKESFRKGKVFDDDIKTAFEFGLRAVSNNPVDTKMLKWAEMDRNIMANQALQQWHKQGDEKFLKLSEKVPEGWQKVDDKYGTVYGPREIEVTAKNSRLIDDEGNPVDREEAGLDQIPPEGTKMKVRVPGLMIIGHRIVKNAVGDILNNYLSSTLYNNRYFGHPYTLWMGFANMLNQTQLGVGSAFHVGFTTLEAEVSAGANLSKDIYGLLRGNRTVTQTMHSAKNVLTATVETGLTGDKVLNAWRNPEGTIDPRIAQVVRAAELAGGGFKMEKGMQTDQVSKLTSDWLNGHRMRAALRSPVAFVELLAKPIMDGIVPRQKAGVFAHMAWRIIEQNPSKTLEDLTPEFRAAWNRIDARLGQVRYDRLFINNTAKNVIQGLVRAPGWTGGTIAELGGAVKDTGTFFNEWRKTGKAPKDLPDRVAYTLSLLIGAALLNGLLTYLFSGKKPEGMDYWAFRTGNKDAKGNDERFMLPMYTKDLLAYWEAPGTTLMHKSHPALSVMSDLYRNQDYYGVQISNPDSNIAVRTAQKGAYIAKSFTPFWIRGAQQNAASGGGPARMALPLIGVMPAPASVTQSAAQKKAAEINRARMPSAPITEQERERRIAKSDLVQQVRQGKTAGISAAVRAGTIKASDVPQILSRAKLTPLQASVNTMSIEQVQKVMKVATPNEKRQIAPILARKVEHSAGVPMFTGF